MNIQWHTYIISGAHLEGKGGDTSPSLKNKSVIEQAICPKNAPLRVSNDLKCPASGFISPALPCPRCAPICNNTEIGDRGNKRHAARGRWKQQRYVPTNNSSRSIFHEELERIYKILQNNYFSRFLIDQLVSSFIIKQVKKRKNSPVTSFEAPKEIRYYKLPCIGRISESLQNKISKISSSFCKSSIAIISFYTFQNWALIFTKRPHSERGSCFFFLIFVCEL